MCVCLCLNAFVCSHVVVVVFRCCVALVFDVVLVVFRFFVVKKVCVVCLCCLRLCLLCMCGLRSFVE